MSKAAAILITALVIGGGALQWQGYQLDAQQTQVRRQTDALEQKNAQQLAQNTRLKERLHDIKNNPDAIFEELAREKLFMIKPDEVYILPESTPR